MELLIVTGMSGAGKSQAVHALEDIGYYCVDNIPPKLIRSFVDISVTGETGIKRFAIVTDVRGGKMFGEIITVLDNLTADGVDYKILFLDATDEILVRRFKELRRRHPLTDAGYNSVTAAVREERNLLRDLRERADYVIDTSLTSVIAFREKIKSLMLDSIDESLTVQSMSFGFKYGVPSDADLVFDVRCLPNPFYIDELKTKTGKDREVYDYVMGFEESKELADKIIELIDFSLRLYCREGKSQLTVAFGCTGGKHRSVTFAEYLAEHLKDTDYNVNINHRDINK